MNNLRVIKILGWNWLASGIDSAQCALQVLAAAA